MKRAIEKYLIGIIVFIMILVVGNSLDVVQQERFFSIVSRLAIMGGGIYLGLFLRKKYLENKKNKQPPYIEKYEQRSYKKCHAQQ